MLSRHAEIDLIDATAADCTLPDQHDAQVNAARKVWQRRPKGSDE
jgi:hypothetical protein